MHINFLATNRCNLLCKHCVRGKQTEYHDLSPEMYGQILIDAKSLGYKTVGFTGGEPCLNPMFEEILDLTVDHDLSFSIATNGLLFSYYDHYYSKYGNRFSLMKVSLDGFKNEYKLIRGVDGFADVIKFINHFKYRVKILVCCCISKINYRLIYDIVKYCAEIGIEAIEMFRIIPCEYNERLTMNDREVMEANELMTRARKDFGRKIKFYYYMMTTKANPICFELEYPQTVVNTKGELLFCCSIPYEGYAVANVAEDGMSKSLEKLHIKLKEVVNTPVDWQTIKHKCEHCIKCVKKGNDEQ